MAASPLALAEAHRVAQVREAAKAQRALSVAFNRLDPTKLDATFPNYLKAALSVINAGRTRAGTLSGTYYNASRKAADLGPRAISVPRGDLAATTASLLFSGPVAIKIATRNGVPLTSAVAAARAETLGQGKRLILNASRDSLLAAVHNDADAQGWARMSDGGPCHFCAMLVSRGPVYRSKTTASFRSHGRCGCSVRPFFDGDPTGGWSPDALALRALWDETGGRDWRNVYNLARRDPGSTLSLALAPKTAAVIVDAVSPLATRIANIKAKLPADRSKIGVREEVFDGEAARAARIAEEEQLAGATIAQFDDAIKHAQWNIDEWTKLDDDIYAMGLTNATKWPLSMQARVKALGFGRRQPKTLTKVLYKSIGEQRFALDRLTFKRLQLQGNIDYLKAADFSRTGTTKRFDDLDALGELGKDTADALDNIKAAGKLVADEVDARLAKLGKAGPSPREVIDKLDDELVQARADWFVASIAKNAAEADRLADLRIALDTRIRALRKTLTEDQLAHAKSGGGATYASVLREVMEEVRPFGKGTGSTYKVVGKNTTDLVARMRTAETKYPTEWVNRLARSKPTVKLTEVDRGFNAGGGDHIALSGLRNGYDTVATHELGHSMEDAIPGLQGAEWAFWHMRSSSVVNGVRTLDPVVDIYGKDIGMGRELAIPDKWATAYTGKSYREGKGGKVGASTAWEIFTTGIESIWDSSPYMTRANALGPDDEFRHFILGALSVL